MSQGINWLGAPVAPALRRGRGQTRRVMEAQKRFSTQMMDGTPLSVQQFGLFRRKDARMNANVIEAPRIHAN